MQGPFLLRLCQRGAFTDFWLFFFFAVHLSRKRKAVQDRPLHEWNKPSPTAGKPERMILYVRPDTSCRTYKTILSTRWFARFHASGCFPFSFVDFFFYGFLFWSFPVQSASTSVYLHFRAFQWAASGSHFRSGRKGNSGIGRESKVKPPVFCGNLQPCG